MTAADTSVVVAAFASWHGDVLADIEPAHFLAHFDDGARVRALPSEAVREILTQA